MLPAIGKLSLVTYVTKLLSNLSEGTLAFYLPQVDFSLGKC